MALGGFFPIPTPGNTGLECRVYVSIVDDAGFSTIDAEVQFRKTNGYASQGNAGGSLTIHGSGAGGVVSGNKTLPSNGGWVKFATAGRQTIWHNADGAAPNTQVRVNGIYLSGSSDFDTAVTYTLYFDSSNGFANYVVLPYAPYNLSIRAGTVETGSFGVDYARSSYDAVDQDLAQWATDSGFANVVWNDTGPSGYTNPKGVPGAPTLTPGTTYYVRVRSHTGAGWGPWSSTISQVTLPATPPGLSVSSSPSGYQATLTFTPPGGVTGVNPYRWERRVTGTTTPVATSDSTSTIATVDSLTPGQSYEWRASAFIGTYQSPWSTWQARIQNKPNTNPGDYFDGATADFGDLNYQWGTDGTGAANASISTAIASGVEGWQVTASSGAAVLYRVTAGLFSAYAARVQVTADAAGASKIQAGQRRTATYWTDVTPGATYVGSLHIRSSRSQRVALEIAWLNSAGAYLSSTYGAEMVVAGSTWTRLAGGGTAPAGAAHAYVQIIDAAGAGWSAWKGGDTFDLDGGMISLGEEFPYFDGNTTDDATYIYDWVNASKPNASISKRSTVAQVGPRELPPGVGARAIIDPNCIPPTPPRPPTIPSDCITEAGIWRRSFAKIPAVEVSDWLSAVPTFEIVTGAMNVSQVRVRMYLNPTDGAPELIDTSSWISEQIISYIPASTVLTIDGVHQRVWAEVAGGESIAADHLLYGSNGVPASWPVLSCGISYALSVDLPVEVSQGDSRFYTYLTTRY